MLGIITIKGFTAEGYEIKKMLKMSKEYQEKNQQAIKLSSAFIPIVRMGVLTGFIGTMVIGSYYALEGIIAVGSFSVLVFLTQRFLWPFTRLGETIDLFERSMASTKRILELLKTKSKIGNKENAVVIENLNKNIRFLDVTFAYSNKKVFSNLNFEITILSFSKSDPRYSILFLTTTHAHLNSLYIFGVTPRDFEWSQLTISHQSK